MSAVPIAATTPAPLLEVDRLSVEFGPADAPVQAASDVSFSVDAGEVVGIVGESLGRAATALAAPADRSARKRARRTAGVRRPRPAAHGVLLERRSLGGEMR
jgi:ABC-type glutathione transport system ATPase component